MLEQNKHCTSSDSTSWLSSVRYGGIGNYHVSQLRPDVADNYREKALSLFKLYGIAPKDSAVLRTIRLTVSAEYYKAKFESKAGSQT
jgi:hypothetical protein